jgi:hemolysin activation/secretion protein
MGGRQNNNEGFRPHEETTMTRKDHKGRGARAAAAAAVLALATSAGSARAQSAFPPLQPRGGLPGQDAPALREPRFAPEQAPRFELPPLPDAPADRLGSGRTIPVRRIEVTGNTALPEARLREIAAAYEGRDVTLEELFRLKDELTLAYVNEGYVNSGAVLPDQDVSDGVVRLEIVEGGLEAVDLTGVERLDPGFLAARIRQGADRPLNINALQERLQLLLLDPSVGRLDARLLPGSRPGLARLEVAVEEADRALSVDLGVANDQSPSIGGTRGEVAFTYRGLLGRGDPLRVALGASEGLREIEAGYAVPLTARDLRFHVEGEVSEADIVDDDVQDLNIESSSRRLTVGLSMPVYETVADRVGLDLSFTRERTRTFLLDEPFSFSPGADEGQSDLSLLRFTQDWLHRGRTRAVSAASTFTLGLNVLGATHDDEEPDGQFLAWLGQAEVVQRLFGEAGGALAIRGTVQLSEDPLLASEQFAIGGLGSVRGYRVNEHVRDNGWAFSVEYRQPVLAWLVPDPERRPEGATLELVPFFDAGSAWNHHRFREARETIASAGLGLRATLPPWLAAELYWGLPLVERDGESEDPLQDAGIGFRVRFSPY